MSAKSEPTAYRCMVNFRDFTPSHVLDAHELVIGSWGEGLPKQSEIRARQRHPTPWKQYHARTQFWLRQWALFAHIPTSALVLVPGDRDDYFVVQPLDMNVVRDPDRRCLSRAIKLRTERLPRSNAPKEIARRLGRGNTCYPLPDSAAKALRSIVLQRPEGGLRPKRSADTAPKYGPGGERSEHKELKEWISQHPQAVGVKGPPGKMEVPLESGDRADILFEEGHGGWAVVEVETEAVGTRQGAFQAIKYRTLLCAEKGLPLGDRRVQGILAAWSVPAEVRQLCAKYAITWRECRAGGRATQRVCSD